MIGVIRARPAVLVPTVAVGQACKTMSNSNNNRILDHLVYQWIRLSAGQSAIVAGPWRSLPIGAFTPGRLRPRRLRKASIRHISNIIQPSPERSFHRAEEGAIDL